MPFYMAIGVSKAEFLDSTPVELEPYDLAYRKRFELEDVLAYRQGVYVRDALISTVGNMFLKKGAKAFEYPSKPYGLNDEPTEEEKRQQNKLLLDSLMMMKKNFEMTHKKKDKNDNTGGGE